MELNNYTCRAKCKDTGEWIYGYYVKHNTVQTCMSYDNPRPKHYIVSDGTACDWGFEPPLQATEVDPYTVCRCPNIKDKNGYMIFENDIIRHIEYGVGRIAYLQQSAGWVFVWKEYDSRMGHRATGSWFEQDSNVEIIGNIFDNTELMEVKLKCGFLNGLA